VRAAVCSTIAISVSICFEDLLDSGRWEAHRSYNEHVAVRLHVLFLFSLLPLLLLPHEHCVCAHGL
jgi:hypothetical protein